eukprot:TRINITY_DN28307_c2_g1_i1.p1 TRINITY_DN28307_c2_g1~~TRINITY_DN28307_c2_g1_i1.p1  ORF type:complete len:563 (+),score=57.72 TRINITY_DN28307_c2_g1_i1:62-1690(+)
MDAPSETDLTDDAARPTAIGRGTGTPVQSPPCDSSPSIQVMADFTPPSEDLIRATRACVPLSCFGSLLRLPLRSADERESEAAQLFERSFVTSKIDAFWSHSWHAPAWQKVLTLMLIYNGLPAALLATGAAIAAAVLRKNGFLPGNLSDSHRDFVVWSTFLAVPIFLLCFTFWKSRSLVFFDKVCIHQANTDLKIAGVASVGVFLQRSSCMLILWDPSYSQRLWCVFELAAHTKAHADLPISTQDGRRAAANIRGSSSCGSWNGSTLLCRPIVSGPTCLSLFATTTFMALAHNSLYNMGGPIISFVNCLVASRVFFQLMRSYHREVQKMRDDFQHFKVSRAECFCCSNNHVDPVSGQAIPCERHLVEGCIVAWFGGLRSFEQYVHSDLFAIFHRQLGTFGILYKHIVLGSLPWIWAQFGWAVDSFEDTDSLLRFFMHVTQWLFAYPTAVAMISMMASTSWAQRDRQHHASHVCAAILGGGFPGLLVTIIDMGLFELYRLGLPLCASLHFGVWATICACTWVLGNCGRLPPCAKDRKGTSLSL